MEPLNRDAVLFFSDHARKQMEDRFIVFDGQMAERCLLYGTVEARPDRRSYRVTKDGFSMILAKHGKRGYKVITVYFRAIDDGLTRRIRKADQKRKRFCVRRRIANRKVEEHADRDG